MREFFLKLFADRPANEFDGISMFSWTHILYLVLIIGAVVLISLLFRKKDLSVRIKVLDIIAILIIAAIITPTSDIFTLALVSTPLLLLYEISIFIVSRTKKIL